MFSYNSPSMLSREINGRHAGLATCRSSPSPFTADAFKTAIAVSMSVTFIKFCPEHTPNILNRSLRVTISAFAAQFL